METTSLIISQISVFEKLFCRDGRERILYSAEQYRRWRSELRNLRKELNARWRRFHSRF